MRAQRSLSKIQRTTTSERFLTGSLFTVYRDGCLGLPSLIILAVSSRVNGQQSMVNGIVAGNNCSKLTAFLFKSNYAI